ncbi:MAG: tetratricopeptide repeat protein [Chlorobiaceae bacterium]|nr:tetratricopeptide repeat protein [Chlorobiaceae bacterium]
MKHLCQLFVFVSFVIMTAGISACGNNPTDTQKTVLENGSKIGAAIVDSSVAQWNKAIAFNPQSAQAYSGRGAFKYAKGDKQGAIEDFTKAIQIDPNSITAHSGRGAARFTVGDITGAIGDFINMARLSFFSRSGNG